VVAATQAGCVTHQQLLDAGLSTSAIHRRVRRGELHRAHRGVYIVGHTALAPQAREWAAVLACGDGSVVSHVSAARVWGLLGESDDRLIDVTTRNRQARPRDGLRIHRCSWLDSEDLTQLHRLPLTTVPRTLIDLAATGSDELERALSEAQARKLIYPRELPKLLDRAEGHCGAARLRRAIEVEKSGFTRSTAERILRKLVRDAHLPQPRSNVRVAGYEVDFHWPEQRLVVEIDGFAFHGHRAAFERDRRKDAVLVAAGYRVIGVTWRQLVEKPIAVAALIASALTATRAPG
jgi:very-short-patch-repair endonuclease